MNPIVITATPLGVLDDDGICLPQTPGAGGGNLILNGVLVSGGVAVLATGDMGAQVTVTTIATETAKTLTFYGTNENGAAITETINGPPASTATLANYWKTITRIVASQAFTSSVRVGVTQVGVSKTVIPDHAAVPFGIGLFLAVNGTVNYTVQHTGDDTGRPTFTPGQANWFDHSSMKTLTAATDGNYAFPVRGIRLKSNSGGGSGTLTLVQGHGQVA
jgi:hypothetical protein